MFNLDPKKMQAVMRQMGINQEEVNAVKVTIETPEKNLILEPATVLKIKMQGNESFQISGNLREEFKNLKFTQSDIQTIMEKTSCSEEQAIKAMEETNDLAEAIIKLAS